MPQMFPPLDSVDLKALTVLMQRGRIAWSELAGALGMSPPAAAERVKRLEERGTIKGFVADVDPKALGLDLVAFVRVGLVASEPPDDFVQWAKMSRWVQECHHVAGDCDYLLKLHCPNTSALESVLTQEIRCISCVSNTNTTIVFSTVKKTPALPIAVGGELEVRPDPTQANSTKLQTQRLRSVQVG